MDGQLGMVLFMVNWREIGELAENLQNSCGAHLLPYNRHQPNTYIGRLLNRKKELTDYIVYNYVPRGFTHAWRPAPARGLAQYVQQGGKISVPSTWNSI